MDWLEDALHEIEMLKPLGDRIAFVSGNFNIVHPGHLRLLNFAAECADQLVVGVFADGMPGTHLPQDLRLEGVRSIGIVDHAFILPEPPDRFIQTLRPSVVVKGKEHENADNIEQAAVDSYGGTLLFGSGEAAFSSLDLLRREFLETNVATIAKPLDYPKRHDFTITDLVAVVGKFSGLRVVIVGDLIVDEYITCEALGMSQEDPTLVVTPITHDRFVGGAGIVAAHARGLGAQVKYFSVVGDDSIADFAEETLADYNVEAHLLRDPSRPTTLKQRHRVADKTLLRVSHLRQHDIGTELVETMVADIVAALDGADLLIFSDFNYGVLPQNMVDQIAEAGRARGVMMVADSQASSQISDVSRFKGMQLLTPTEREARLALRDTRAGLAKLADELIYKAQARHVLITLGAEGLLIHAPHEYPRIITDRLPSFNKSPKDVSGAGDSLLTCTAMAMAVGADIWQSVYLGAVAAACQVGRVGNLPLTSNQIIGELTR